MKWTSLRGAALAAALLVTAVFGLTGCASKDIIGVLNDNKRPSVELTNAPVAPDKSSPYFYAYRVNWKGEDPDGRVDYFQYAVDPPDPDQVAAGADTTWIRTERNEETVFFRASVPDSIRGNSVPTASDFHIFVIRAVDDEGSYSLVKNRAFYSYTIAPSVNIRNPLPTNLLSAKVTPSVRIEWEGADPDGQFSQKPVRYLYKMLDLGDPQNKVFLGRPDSLRDQEFAKNWDGWIQTSADTQFVQFTNLTPRKEYLFVVIGFDEAGAYSPVFTLNSNCLWLEAGFASSNGPKIHIFNQFIDFAYQSAGYSPDPLREIPIEVPTRVPITVNWDAAPSPGSRIQGFRWMVNGNINDETRRTDENNDYVHWSQESPTMPGTAILRPFMTDGDYRFYLECSDNNGQKSLGILKMTAVTPTFDRTLLIVDDTRREVDKFSSPGLPNIYTDRWPSATELDTFLFAKGGFPWRGARNPTTAVSYPGVFAGYPLDLSRPTQTKRPDTLGTRLGLENPARGVLLSNIGQYRSLVWMVDEKGASFLDTQDQSIFPLTALAAMSGPGRASTLAAYTQLGGRVWLMGGGSAYASLRAFDRLTPSNNRGQTTIFSSAPQFGELAPGRIMYDGAHWQSVIAITLGNIFTIRNDYSIQTRWADGSIHDTSLVVAPSWSHFDRYTGTTISSPNYSKLPVEMRQRTEATDPLPPTRLSSQSGLFYLSSYPCEYLLDVNSILEDVDPDPAVSREIAVLDTLYQARGVVLLTNRTDPETGENVLVPAPTMTYYHGNQARQFVFTGFAPWSYARQDCIGLVDFVLQDLWGLPRDPSIDRGSFAPAYIRSGAPKPARSVQPVKRTTNAMVSTGTNRE